MTNPAVQQSRRTRLRLVEELMLNGLKTREIYDSVGPRFGVTYGTVRNDVAAVNKAHKALLDKGSELEGREKYLASLYQMRRKALAGWTEEDQAGNTRIRGRDLRLAHNIDKEIAKIQGVELFSDSTNVHLTLEKARAYLDRIMGIVFTHVRDEETQGKILSDLEKIDDDGSE